MIRFEWICRNPEVRRLPSGTHGADRGGEAPGEDSVQHPRGRRGPRPVPRLLPPKRPRSARPSRPLHAEGPRYGIRLSGAAVVGPEGRALLRAAAPRGASNRRESIARSWVRIVSRATVRKSRQSWRLAVSRAALTNGGHDRPSTERASWAGPTRTTAGPAWVAGWCAVA